MSPSGARSFRLLLTYDPQCYASEGGDIAADAKLRRVAGGFDLLRARSGCRGPACHISFVITRTMGVMKKLVGKNYHRRHLEIKSM